MSFDYDNPTIVNSTSDWPQVLRTLQTNWRDNAASKAKRGSPQWVSLGGQTVGVQARWTEPAEDEAGEDPYILTHVEVMDHRNNSSPVGTLAGRTTVQEILNGLWVKGDLTEAAATAAVEIGIAEQTYGGRGAVIAAMLSLFIPTLPTFLNKKFEGLYPGSGTGGSVELAAMQKSWHDVLKGESVEGVHDTAIQSVYTNLPVVGFRDIVEKSEVYDFTLELYTEEIRSEQGETLKSNIQKHLLRRPTSADGQLGSKSNQQRRLIQAQGSTQETQGPSKSTVNFARSQSDDESELRNNKISLLAGDEFDEDAARPPLTERERRLLDREEMKEEKATKKLKLTGKRKGGDRKKKVA